MKLKLINCLSRILIISITFSLCTLSFATVSSLNVPADCEKFNQPSTVILACANWNEKCLSFTYIFEALSNEPKNNSWRFYKIDTRQVPETYCGKKRDNTFIDLFVKNAKGIDINTDAIMKESNLSFSKKPLMALLANANPEK